MSMDEEVLVKMVRGTPTPEEVAALVSVLAARTADADVQAVSSWMLSGRPSAGPSSWRESGLPR